MKRVAAKSLTMKRSAGARGLVVLIAALGLLLQSFITQTHIHSGTFETGIIFHSDQPSSPAKNPLDKAGSCPFCQAIVHAGAFVTPVAPLVYLSSAWVKTTFLSFIATPTTSVVSHGWRSRAPPRH
jgi:hypothetical protein